MKDFEGDFLSPAGEYIEVSIAHSIVSKVTNNGQSRSASTTETVLEFSPNDLKSPEKIIRQIEQTISRLRASNKTP